MSRLIFITHPEVLVDPSIDVRNWRLSATGRKQMERFSASSVVSRVTAIWSSNEVKAIEAADILGRHVGVVPECDARLAENDRTATGFLEPGEFERVADAFFEHPCRSVRGWERAVDAQKRISDAVDSILTRPRDGDVALVSHGAVGSLLLCSWADYAISRAHDQPSQGHFWLASLSNKEILHVWRPIGQTAD